MPSKIRDYIISRSIGEEFTTEMVREATKSSSGSVSPITKELIKRKIIKEIPHNGPGKKYVLISKEGNPINKMQGLLDKPWTLKKKDKEEGKEEDTITITITGSVDAVIKMVTGIKK
jgi:hypothetical protein